LTLTQPSMNSTIQPTIHSSTNQLTVVRAGYLMTQSSNARK
jgi:hypothetical protein